MKSIKILQLRHNKVYSVAVGITAREEFSFTRP